jgi:hypothetical protein
MRSRGFLGRPIVLVKMLTLVLALLVLSSCSGPFRVGDFVCHPFSLTTPREYVATIAATDGSFFLNSRGVADGTHDTFSLQVDDSGQPIDSAELIVYARTPSGDLVRTTHTLGVARDGFSAGMHSLTVSRAELIQIRLRPRSQAPNDAPAAFRGVKVTLHTALR